MKRCVQWNPVYDWKDLRLRQGSYPPTARSVGQRQPMNALIFFSRSDPVSVILLNSKQFTSHEWWLDDFRFYSLSKVVQ